MKKEFDTVVIGGAVVSLVHGVALLCDKCCYKEVSVG